MDDGLKILVAGLLSMLLVFTWINSEAIGTKVDRLLQQNNSADTSSRAPSEGRGSPPAAPLDLSNPYRRLFDAIRMVESGGNDRAIGDEGRALGPYQITAVYWRDGCEAGGVTWDYHAGVWDRARCEYVMYLYWTRHGARTDEQRARMHSGGPRGPQKASTLAYWQRVKALRETP